MGVNFIWLMFFCGEKLFWKKSFFPHPSSKNFIKKGAGSLIFGVGIGYRLMVALLFG